MSTTESPSPACLMEAGRRLFSCTAFRKLMRCGRRSRRAWRKRDIRSSARTCGAMAIREAPMPAGPIQLQLSGDGRGPGSPHARLGHERFHVIGHDRGGRTAHRMALDHAGAIRSVAVLDIVPTYAMFMETNRKVAGAYWHWYFLSQPEPLPERMIGADPDFFYETCLAGSARGLAGFRRRAACGVPPRLAQPGNDPRLVLRLSGGGLDRPRP